MLKKLVTSQYYLSEPLANVSAQTYWHIQTTQYLKKEKKNLFKVNIRLANEEMPCFLWSQKVHQRVQKNRC
jgi:hypothetical protein